MESANQKTALMDFVNQSNAAAGNYNSATPIDMSLFKQALYLLNVGVLSGTGTVDARLQSCKYSSFNTGVHNISGSNITQITNSTGNTNTWVKLTVRADQVSQLNAGDRYVRLNTTIGTASVNYQAVGIGMEAVQAPANQNENTTLILQNVTV